MLCIKPLEFLKLTGSQGLKAGIYLAGEAQIPVIAGGEKSDSF